MRISFNPVYSRANLIPFRGAEVQQTKIQQDPLSGDKLIIRTPKEGLIKQNSFLHPNLELKNKTAEEKGVFATGAINKGEIVCIFVGDIFSETELKKLPMDLQRKTLQLAPDIYQLASKNPNNKEAFDAAEYFNHNCDPNLFLTGNNVLIAAKDIKAGDIVSVDTVKGIIKNITRKKSYKFEKYPSFMQKIITAGGLMKQLKKRKT